MKEGENNSISFCKVLLLVQFLSLDIYSSLVTQVKWTFIQIPHKLAQDTNKSSQAGTSKEFVY